MTRIEPRSDYQPTGSINVLEKAKFFRSTDCVCIVFLIVYRTVVLGAPLPLSLRCSRFALTPRPLILRRMVLKIKLIEEDMLMLLPYFT
ncbi:hypothetical protein CDAR_374051 [Caerostris darwini]|uniref:Uncharacterized protein n=1 Tax=Caerostris darwini TaxID=1538125 RepID=A0AAV4VJC6_9ARAC|nr:hypothetical protein CDAR_374051 [Caerostris darwini]